MAQIIHKVAAYITAGNWLLVFTEPAFPEAGTQIPCGTVEESEDLDSAMLREAVEETGLTRLHIKRFLGTCVYHLQAKNGEPVTMHRHFYHLVYDGHISADGWRHWEQDPSDGKPEPIEFALRWVKFPQEVPDLVAGFGDMLPALMADR